MDPNPTTFPILSYVMSRIPQLPFKAVTDSWNQIDIEQPPLPSDGSNSNKSQEYLPHQMPHLNHPEVVASMTLAVSDVAKTRSFLQALGDRPNHESVDTARSMIAEIESELTKKLEEILLGPRPEGVDPIQWQEEEEKECKQEAEKKKEIYKAVVRLDEMHEDYENLLRNAEERLVKIYSSAAEAEKGVANNVEKVEEEEVNEEVIGILQEAEKGLERVELSGRKLRIFPEAFGKLRGLIALNVSSNQLLTIPDSIAGLEHLEELNLSSNLLESLPDSIGLLLNLKTLDVSSNKLKVLPNSISHCRSLVELDASYNALTYLPTNIGFELLNLSRLSIQLNKIRSLPTSICEMRSLLHLDAHFNELHGLPYAIGRLTNLEILNLSSNFSDLTELPETFGDLINLKELDLSNNQIHALPNTFGRLQSLTKLTLDQNPLVIPPMEIVNNGVEAVKNFMGKMWLDILLEEELKSRAEANNQAPNGWLTRSTSLLTRSTSMMKNWASAASESVTEYLGGGANSPRDPHLNQQL